MTKEDSYQSGQTAFYHEDGEVDEVLVLENNSDKDWIKYKLEVKKVLQESSFVKPNDVGDRANVAKARDSDGCGLLWHLLDE
jgi:hypothetical protein